MIRRTLVSHSALVALATLTAAALSSPSTTTSVVDDHKKYRPSARERMDTEGFVRRNKSDRKRNKRQRW